MNLDTITLNLQYNPHMARAWKRFGPTAEMPVSAFRRLAPHQQAAFLQSEIGPRFIDSQGYLKREAISEFKLYSPSDLEPGSFLAPLKRGYEPPVRFRSSPAKQKSRQMARLFASLAQLTQRR